MPTLPLSGSGPVGQNGPSRATSPKSRPRCLRLCRPLRVCRGRTRPTRAHLLIDAARSHCRVAQHEHPSCGSGGSLPAGSRPPSRTPSTARRSRPPGQTQETCGSQASSVSGCPSCGQSPENIEERPGEIQPACALSRRDWTKRPAQHTKVTKVLHHEFHITRERNWMEKGVGRLVRSFPRRVPRAWFTGDNFQVAETRLDLSEWGRYGGVKKSQREYKSEFWGGGSLKMILW
jgi:hypothetical protein